MSDKNLRLQVVLNAVDKITRPLKLAQSSVKSLASVVKESKNQLKQLNDQSKLIDAFRDTSAKAAVTAQNLKKAKEEAAALAVQFKQTANPTAQQAKLLQHAKDRANDLQSAYNGLRLSVQKQREGLSTAGINTRKLNDAQKQLKERVTSATSALERQEDQLKRTGAMQRKMAAIRAQNEKTKEMRNSLAANGAGMMATGVATGMPLLTPIKAFSESEDAAMQLQASMMGAGGNVSAEYAKINALAVSLGDKLPGTTADFQNMMTMLRRQGMSAKSILGGLGEATAYLGVQLKMQSEAAAEFAAKMQDATGTSEKDMMSLMDVIQKSFYAGVDPTNMLSGFAKISSAMSILRKDGIEAAKELAPFLVMADQQGMEGGSAGNAYRKIFQGMMNSKKISSVNATMKATGSKVRFDFTDGKGEFGGIDKMYRQLDQMKNIPTQQRLETIKGLFGDDSETLQVLDNMIKKGIAGYKETEAKLSQQASLRERVDSQLKITINKWDAATGTFRNVLAEVGATVAPDLKRLIDGFGNLAEKLGEFVRENPQLVSTAFKAVAVFAAISGSLGILAISFAALIGPMAVMRMAFASIGIKLPSIIGMLGGLAQGISALFAGLLSPIGLVVAALAGIAVVIWRNWQPISAFLGGVVEGFKSAAAPIAALFDPLIPAFQWFGDKVQKLFGWLTNLLVPIQYTSSELQNAANMGKLFGEALVAGISMVMHPLASLKSGVSWLLEKLGVVSKEAAKAKLPAQVTQQLPTVGYDKRPPLPTSAYPATRFAGMYDSGGYIPSGKFGIAGEYGPEFVNGPARITSRKQTAIMAAVASLGLSAAVPAATAPLHPFSLPAAEYKTQSAAPAAQRNTPIVSAGKTEIHIHAAPNQSPQDIARIVMQAMDERDRKQQARARRQFSDREVF